MTTMGNIFLLAHKIRKIPEKSPKIVKKIWNA
jgi:hypothetical protein